MVILKENEKGSHKASILAHVKLLLGKIIGSVKVWHKFAVLRYISRGTSCTQAAVGSLRTAKQRTGQDLLP